MEDSIFWRAGGTLEAAYHKRPAVEKLWPEMQIYACVLGIFQHSTNMPPYVQSAVGWRGQANGGPPGDMCVYVCVCRICPVSVCLASIQ